MEVIELRLDEQNELVFEVSIQADSSHGRPVYRFICEADDVSYGFVGTPVSDNQVRFVIPSMAGKIVEGDFRSHLEVVVESRLFIPVEMTTSFKPMTTVVAESVRVVPKDKPMQATAKLIKGGQPKAKPTVKPTTKPEPKRVVETPVAKKTAIASKNLTLQDIFKRSKP